MNQMRLTYPIAWQKGNDAWHQGLGLEVNPHVVDSNSFEAWYQGWKHAENANQLVA